MLALERQDVSQETFNSLVHGLIVRPKSACVTLRSLRRVEVLFGQVISKSLTLTPKYHRQRQPLLGCNSVMPGGHPQLQQSPGCPFSLESEWVPAHG
jgi:hypothetical protein